MEGRQFAMPAVRQQEILRYIKSDGNVQIKDLARTLSVSEATIRRDLDELATQGRLERTYGGAIYIGDSTAFERHHQEKMKMMTEEKRRVAQKAASLIKRGDTLFIDSSTTTYYLAKCISEIQELTIFTHDLVIASDIDLHPTSTLIVTGGIRRQGYKNVLLGGQVEGLIRGIKVDKVFLGAGAVDLEYGVSNANFQEAAIKTLLTRIGNKTIVVCDHSKFGKTALTKVCGLEDVDIIITDDGIDGEYAEKLREAGPTVIEA